MSFSEDNWFRNSILAVILAVVTAAFIIAIVAMFKSSSQQAELQSQQSQLKQQQLDLKSQEQGLKRQQQALKANVNAQVTNRTKNVYTWCHAIDAERTILVTYIANVNARRARVPFLDLPLLDCKAIADRTLASAHHK